MPATNFMLSSLLNTKKAKAKTEMAAARAKKQKRTGLVPRRKPSVKVRKPKAEVWAQEVLESGNIASGKESSNQEESIQFEFTELFMMQYSTDCSCVLEV